MADHDDKDLDAAERALGTEPRDREIAEEHRARKAWDDHLAPLALAAPPAEPPADMFERIERGLDGAGNTAKIVQLAERRARRWRALAIASGAVAACLALWIAAAPLGLLPEEAPARNYVALVTPEGGSGPAMIVEVDIQTGVATVRALRVAAPQGRALELWRIPSGQAPQSVGLVDPDQPTLLNVAAEPGDVMAITVEPPGGAPGGVPSGPPILSGPLIATR
ncbi:MAG: anti-sigma factor domain-containing protein [Kiloniellaceae bacterium]